MFELTGKTAIITGASRGIGKEIAMKFAKQGANIAFLHFMDEENAKQTQAELSELGVKVCGYECNVADFEACKAAFDKIIEDCTTGKLSTDPQARWNALYDAEKIVMNDAAIFPLYTQCNAEMISPSVTGIEFHPVALNRVFKNAVKSE